MGSDAELEPPELSEPQPASLGKGRRLGRYVLCYELASGGMATVYLGRTEGPSGFGRLVAIKVIHPHLARQREFVEMFLDEARIASRIVHPNVCSVFDYGEEDGTYFLAMDYLVGENAGRVARALARKPEVAARPGIAAAMARIVADACEGLHAAHEMRNDDGTLANVVHRDVTPHNLFVGYDGSVRVVDFGVALAVGRHHHTTAGTLKGKFPYMSPEQIAREEIDRRSDVWALGVCLWELLTRRRLFRRDSEYHTLQAVTSGAIPAASTMMAGVPEVLDAVIARALDRDRDRRYASARAMGRDLNAALGTLGGASSADVAELMDALFAEERADRAALLEKARRVDPEQPSTSKITRVGMQESGSVIPGSAPSVPPPRPPAPVTGDPTKRWAIGIAAVSALVATVAIVGWLATEGSRSDVGPVAVGGSAEGGSAEGASATGTGAEGAGATGRGAEGRGATGTGAEGEGAEGTGATGTGGEGTGAEGTGEVGSPATGARTGRGIRGTARLGRDRIGGRCRLRGRARCRAARGGRDCGSPSLARERIA